MNFNPLHHPVIYNQPPLDAASASAWCEHLPFSMFLMSVLRPRVLVELGSVPGALSQVAQILATGTQCHSIDAEQKNETYLAQFADGTVDLLNIDILPTTEAVKYHFETWLPKISSDSVVLIHGINTKESGIQEAWELLKSKYPHFEFTHGQGLGILAIGGIAAPELQEFFSASQADIETIRSFFFRMGEHNQEHYAYQALRDQYHNKRESEFAKTAAKLKQDNSNSEEGWRTLQNQLDMIVSSRGWRLLQLLWAVSRRFAPRDTTMHRGLEVLINVVQRIFAHSAIFAGKFIRLSEYAQWVAQNEPRAEQLRRQRLEAERLAYQPLISIITPIYNTPPRLLEEMIRSVVGQTYGHWQLCLADGNSTNEKTKVVLQKWANKDQRVKVSYLEQNLGISGNSNAARRLAEGEFIALLDHDDLLAPFALYEVAKLLNERPETDFIYSDRDMVSEDSAQRFAPFFKPGWSPEIMLAANYLCHLCVIRKRMADEAGEFNPATDGAQDWDFFLRVMERTDRVAHIPKVLYHWRQWSNSSASGIAAKPYAVAAQKRAVREHLQRRGLEAETAVFPGGVLRATWPISGKTKVSIIILTDEEDVQAVINLEMLLGSTGYRNFELLLACPNGAAQMPIGYLREVAPDIPIRLVTHEPTTLPSVVYNMTAGQATGELLLFLNAASETIRSGWLEEMVRWAEVPGVGVAGAKLVDADGIVRHVGVAVGVNGLAGYPLSGLPENSFSIFGSTEWYRNWSAVGGDCLMIGKELFWQLGGFDEDAAHSDLELCLKAQAAGLRVVYTPHAKLRHTGALRRHFANNAQAPGQLLMRASEACDPFYSPNLSTEATIPQLNTGSVITSDHV